MKKSTKRFIWSLIISFAFALILTVTILIIALTNGIEVDKLKIYSTILCFCVWFLVCLVILKRYFVEPIEQKEKIEAKSEEKECL